MKSLHPGGPHHAATGRRICIQGTPARERPVKKLGQTSSDVTRTLPTNLSPQAEGNAGGSLIAEKKLAAATAPTPDVSQPAFGASTTPAPLVSSAAVIPVLHHGHLSAFDERRDLIDTRSHSSPCHYAELANHRNSEQFIDSRPRHWEVRL
jgi:hypothetical protein